MTNLQDEVFFEDLENALARALRRRDRELGRALELDVEFSEPYERGGWWFVDVSSSSVDEPQTVTILLKEQNLKQIGLILNDETDWIFGLMPDETYKSLPAVSKRVVEFLYPE